MFVPFEELLFALEPKTNFPVFWRMGPLLCAEPLAVFCCFLSEPTWMSLAGAVAGVTCCLVGFPSNLLPPPVKGVNFGSSSLSTAVPLSIETSVLRKKN